MLNSNECLYLKNAEAGGMTKSYVAGNCSVFCCIYSQSANTCRSSQLEVSKHGESGTRMVSN